MVRFAPCGDHWGKPLCQSHSALRDTHEHPAEIQARNEGIETVIDSDGTLTNEWASLNCRVVDNALDMPIGLVLHVQDGKGAMKYEALPLYTNHGEPLDSPNADGWGPRYYDAAESLWRDWNTTLPPWMRAKRWLSRWIDVLWWLVGIATGFGLSVVLQSMSKAGGAG